MAYRPRELNVIGYTNGFTLWHYRAERAEECLEPGFFDSASDMLCAGDLVLASGPGGAAQLYVAEVVEGPRIRGTVEHRPGAVRVVSLASAMAAISDSVPEPRIPDTGRNPLRASPPAAPPNAGAVEEAGGEPGSFEPAR
ncbi:MAG: hypothetical protein WCF16_10270 [Alphaproteobacteria bacterium]